MRSELRRLELSWTRCQGFRPAGVSSASSGWETSLGVTSSLRLRRTCRSSELATSASWPVYYTLHSDRLLPAEEGVGSAHGTAPRQSHRPARDPGRLRLLAPALLPASAPARGPAARPLFRRDRRHDRGQPGPVLPDDRRREHPRPALRGGSQVRVLRYG